MLWSIAVLLVILWALGMITGNTIDGVVHVFLVLAVVVIIIRLVTGRKIV